MLIRTKLHLPFARPGLIPRPRLQARIAEGLRGPLTLITAPAGFGKTTLVASCVAGCGVSVAWLSLDRDDNQAGRFLNYLVAALQETDPEIGSEAAQLLATHQAPPEAVLTSLVNDLDITGRGIALVLDDYQFISSQAAHEAVAFLLEHGPQTFHLVIASRSDPPLPVSRLRARGQTVELRTADLSFTESEAAQFLNDVMGLRLDAGSVAVLKERTEGWIAGLQMAALSMRDRKDVCGFIEDFSGTNRYILDYLLEEVLASQSPEIQRFLLCTSILERLTAPLCDAVLADDEGVKSQSTSILEYLERVNLFLVPLDDERCWYRYHHLFADLLQARLNQSGADRVAQLRSHAAEWCEGEGQVAEAIGYALAAGDYQRAGRLIASYWYIAANNGEIGTVGSWMDALPEDTVKQNAPLGIAYCWVLWLTGQVGAIEAHLVNAETALNEQIMAGEFGPDDADYADLPAQIALLHSVVARYNNDCEAAVVLAERAISLLPKDLPPQDNVQLRALISFALASAYDSTGDLERAVSAYTEHIRLSRKVANIVGIGIIIRLIGALRLLGRLREADTACRDALAYVQAQGMSRLPAAGILYVAMSEVLVEQNELEAAEAHLAQGLEIGKWSGRLDAARNAAYAQSRLRQARHDANGALAAIQEVESAMGESQSPLARAELLALRARIRVRQGSLSEAAQCIEEAGRLVGQDRGQTAETVVLAASRLRFAQSDPDEAIVELTRSLAATEDRGWVGAALELRILRSLALARTGNTREAEVDLEHTLSLAESEGYVRLFLDEGRPMQMLLTQWLAHAGAGPLRDYATRLLSQFDAEPHEGAAAPEEVSPTGELIEPLSQRELEVLRLIALGSTNKEIARQLFVAPGTVKAHTASIYRKLDVANRTEAVARARQLGLL